MRTFIITLFLLMSHWIYSNEMIIPPLPFSSSVQGAEFSLVVDKEGNMISTWMENGVIAVSELPLHGNWSLPIFISNMLGKASTPKIEIDSLGKITILWFEENQIKLAHRLSQKEWSVTTMAPTLLELRPEKSDQESQVSRLGLGLLPKEISGEEIATNGRIQIGADPFLPGANAIDAPTGGAFSGAQIGFSPGTSAPSNGAIIAGQVGIATSAPASSSGLLVVGTINNSSGEFITINGNSNSTYQAFYTNTTRQGYLGTNTSGSGMILNSDTSGGLTLQASGANPINFFANSTNIARITGNGLALGSSFVGTSPPTGGSAIISGIVGIGTSSPTAQLHIGGGGSFPAWTTNGIALRSQAATFTDTSSSGTVASTTIHNFAQPTIAASNSVTYTAASTFLIANAPAAGTNVAITNPLAFQISAGKSFLGDSLLVSPGTSSTLIDADRALGINAVATIGASGTYSLFGTKGSTVTFAANNNSVDQVRLSNLVLATTSSSYTGLTYKGINLANNQITKTGDGTFANAYGIYSGTFSSIGTNQYGGYFIVPTGGTINQALYADNLSVNYSANNPPPGGAIISGAVGIGTTGPLSKLDVSGGVAIGSTYAGTLAAPTDGLAVTGTTIIGSASAPSFFNVGTTTTVFQVTSGGIVTSGTWNGAVILGAYGGTGVANTGLTINLGSGAAGKVLISDVSGNGTWGSAASAGAITQFAPDSGTNPVLPTSGGLVTMAGSGSLTTVGNSNTLTFQLTGLTNHAVLVGAGTSTITKVGPTATAGQVFQSGGSSADPSFSTPTYPSASGSSGVILRSDGTNNVYTTATYPATTTINQVLYSSANNVIGGITASNNGVLISGATGIPSWLAAGTTGQVLAATTGGPASWSSLGSLGAITQFAPDSGTNPVVPTSGGLVTMAGSGSLTTVGNSNTLTFQLTGLTNHAVLVGAGTSTITKVGPTATAGQVFQSGGSSADPSFSTPTYPSASGSSGVILRSDGTNNVYTTATYPATTTINQVLYSSANNVIGGITASNNGVLISGATGIPSWLAAGTTGQVLAATTGGPASWSNLSSLGVTSIAGTANQISASASTGPVTLALTDGISIGSYQATTSPTGGIICPGQIGIGTSAPGTYFTKINVTASNSFAIGAGIAGTVQGTVGLITANDQTGFTVLPTFAPSGGATVSNSFLAYFYPQFSATGAASSTIANTFGIYVNGGQLNNGTVTNAYGGYFVNPGFGSNKAALYADNFVTGTVYATTTPPTNGAIIAGQVGIGTSSPGVSYVNIQPTGTVAATAVNITGTIQADSGATEVGLRVTPAFSPNQTTTDYFINLDMRPTVTLAHNSVEFYGIFYSPTLATTASNFTLSTYYGFRAAVPAKTGSGVVTNAYSGYFAAPTLAANNVALYADNLSLGFTGTTSPANGAMISGNVGIGTSSPLGKLDVFAGSNTSVYQESAVFRVSNNVAGTNYSRIAFGQNATNVSFIEAANQSNTKGTLLLQPFGGNIGANTSSINTDAIINIGGTWNHQYSYGLYLYTTFNTSTSISDQQAMLIIPTFSPTGGAASPNFYGINLSMLYGGAGPGSSVTVPAAYGVFVGAGSGSLPTNLTITTSYGGYFTQPGVGSNKHALHADNLSVGTYTGTVAPNNGDVIISGKLGVSTSSIGPNPQVQIGSGTFSSTAQMNITSGTANLSMLTANNGDSTIYTTNTANLKLGSNLGTSLTINTAQEVTLSCTTLGAFNINRTDGNNECSMRFNTSGTPKYSMGYHPNLAGSSGWFVYDNSANTFRMVIISSGNVGIGTANPGFLLDVIGSAAKTGGGSWSVSSDHRIKTDIQDMSDQDCLNYVTNVRLRKYKYHPVYRKRCSLEDRYYIGVIAQELLETCPEAIQITPGETKYEHKDPQSGETSSLVVTDLQNVNMSELNMCVFGAIKKLKETVDYLTAHIEELENKIRELENRK